MEFSISLFFHLDNHSTYSYSYAVLNANTKYDGSVTPVKKVYIHPPSATRILLPDGRHVAYHEFGVPADRARFSLIAPHSFLSSRLAGKI